MRSLAASTLMILLITGMQASAKTCPSTIKATELVSRGFSLDYANMPNYPGLKDQGQQALFFSKGACKCALAALPAKPVEPEYLEKIKSRKALVKFLTNYGFEDAACPPSEEMGNDSPVIICLTNKADVCKGKAK